MGYDWKWILRLCVVLVMTVLGVEASASEPLRVYTVKNIAKEVDNIGKAFAAREPQNPVVVTGGVPELGFSPFASGHHDILICPQGQLDPTKVSAAAEGFQLTETPVGSYGMAIVVNASLGVSELTLADVRRLFVGEYTNWAQLYGPNEPINVYTREPNAGATVYMKTKLLGEADFTSTATEYSFDREIIHQISKTTGSVGYVRVNRLSGTNLKAIALKKEPNSQAIMPSEEKVIDGSYPLTVILAAHWNASSKKTSSIIRFVNFCKENQLGLK